MNFLSFAASILLLSTLCADVADHLKPIFDKEGDHSYANIDYIYIINLDERPEKYQSCVM